MNTRHPLPPPHLLASLFYNGLVRSAWLDNLPSTARFWQRLWHTSGRMLTLPVRTTIHGRQVILNYGHTYPYYARKFRGLNNPLIELVYQCCVTNAEPVTLIDVGANIGDTVLLLNSNCPDMVRQFYCIDGDPEFFAYLQQNVGDFPQVRLFFTLLSAAEGQARELLRTHAGTASMQGSTQARVQTLDALLLETQPPTIDVLKIDVDGFDGKVLLGSQRLLQTYRPAVIFEWHPTLCQKTGNNWTDHFEALGACGYNRFVWFDKFGAWSHFTEQADPQRIALIAELCLHSRTYVDWHYDVIALHESSQISALRLAELRFARHRRSPF